MNEFCEKFEKMMSEAAVIDLETASSNKIFMAGALFRGHSLKINIQNPVRDLRRLDAFAADASFIIGHNIIGHDLPVIKAIVPDLKLLKKRIIDTLYLSPLAFPENPYHRLVKDYKLVRSSLSDPVEDCRLAASVLKDQISAFDSLKKRCLMFVIFTDFCFTDSAFAGFRGDGMSDVFINEKNGEKN